jgi:Spy/CpxP family protein refolding chaperone
MSKMKYIIIACMSLTLLCSTGRLAAAQDGPGMPPPRGGPGMERPMGPPPLFEFREFTRRLELTDEQRARIRGILEENRDLIVQAGHNIRQAQLNLDAGTSEAAEALGAAYTEAALLRMQILEQIKQLLTTEQLSLLEEMRKLRKERFEEFPGPFLEGSE